jgi:hypothetical protein
MKVAALASLFLLPVLALASNPSPLQAVDGRDLSFFLKRYDGPLAILHSVAKGKKRHIVPRTLQVEEIPVRRALVERQQCLDAGYLVCPSGTECCPAGYTCGTNVCCPTGTTTLMCTGICKNQSRSLLYLYLRSHTHSFNPSLSSSSSGCIAGQGDCCPNAGCCPTGQVSTCTLSRSAHSPFSIFSSVVPQVCFTALNGDIGCCPIGQTCTAVSGQSSHQLLVSRSLDRCST